jgi:hypothetical protein
MRSRNPRAPDVGSSWASAALEIKRVAAIKIFLMRFINGIKSIIMWS